MHTFTGQGLLSVWQVQAFPGLAHLSRGTAGLIRTVGKEECVLTSVNFS